ncbi:amidase family protein [Tissierella creatinophila]|uniref:Glutamyl-tRNA(Gln) amidotransferase subunit A n=1 Tax=Tissierella creatinophila DSM 6911 TaxID=1123403 RepID=A0A1U7M8Q2_TISCR|nr:amidase family protein [Tissierella creatinophila]OLS03692.1 glutamyl-tRNA(Gln) amidotransferase subunit A [Tissierella creatinophila DSM 6911]
MDKLYKTIDREKIKQREKVLQLKKENGETLGNLFGMRIALEDSISTKEMLTSVGAKMLENYIPPFDATIVEKVLDEDAIVTGKIDIREFGVGKKIDSNLGRVLKEDGADVSIGGDTSGEIRIEAVESGLYGLKPTYGSISRYGVIGSAPSLEQVGIISKDVETMKKVFYTISGKDKKDSTTFNRKDIELKGIDKIKIGVPKEYLKDLDEALQKEMDKTLEEFKKLGCSIDYITIPSAKYASSIYNILQAAEFSSDMGKFDGVFYGYRTKGHLDNEDFFKQNRTKGLSIDVKKKIMFGNFVLSKDNYEDYYEKSQKIRTLIKDEVNKRFEQYDIILSPIVGEDINYTVIANIVGTPEISLPSIYEKEKFGIGIMGKSSNEELLFKLALNYEEKILNSKEEGGKDE